MAGPARAEPRSGRLGGPDAPDVARGRDAEAELGQDGHRVRVPFSQPGQRQVPGGQRGQGRPAGQGLALAGQR